MKNSSMSPSMDSAGSTESSLCPPPAKVVRRKIIRKKLHAAPTTISSPTTVSTTSSTADDDDFFNLTKSYEEEESKALIEKMLVDKEEEDEKAQQNNSPSDNARPASRSSTTTTTAELSQIINNTLLGTGPIPDRLLPSSDVIELSDSDDAESVDISDDDFRQSRKRRRSEKDTVTAFSPPALSPPALSPDVPSIVEAHVSPLVVSGEEEEFEVVGTSFEPGDQSVDFEEEDSLMLDPALLEKIKQRKAELAALNSQSFTVGIIIRTIMDDIDDVPPYVATELSTRTLGEIRSQYIQWIQGNPSVSPESIEFIYSNCIFVWNNTQVYDFATPQTLGVTAKSPSMLLSAMTLLDFEKSQEEEFKQRIEQVDYDELVGKQLESIQEANLVQDGGENGDDGFRISMKGKDNVSLQVMVNPDTKIEKLIEYYRAQRNIPATAKVMLEFDDEELNPSDAIQDTELEEDFTIDVHVS